MKAFQAFSRSLSNYLHQHPAQTILPLRHQTTPHRNPFQNPEMFRQNQRLWMAHVVKLQQPNTGKLEKHGRRPGFDKPDFPVQIHGCFAGYRVEKMHDNGQPFRISCRTKPTNVHRVNFSPQLFTASIRENVRNSLSPSETSYKSHHSPKLLQTSPVSSQPRRGRSKYSLR